MAHYVNQVCRSDETLTLFSIITPFDACLKILWKMEHLLQKHAPFSIIFSKVFKSLLEFFKCCLKIENDVIMI